MERESLDGREGDDERTENERSPPPRSRPTTREHSRKEAERRRSRANTPVPAKIEDKKDGHDLKEESNHQDRKRRHSRSRSRSALRDRDQTGSGLDENNVDKKSNSADVNGNKHHEHKHEHGHDGGLDQESRAPNENGMKKRKRVRHRNRNSRKRHHNRHDHRHDHRGPDRYHENHNNKRYKPYTELSWEERQQRDEQESKRATQRRANRPTPYNTTQFLMEDHKVDTPDLSSVHNMQCDSSDEIEDEMNGDYLEKDFSAVYEEVQSERLESMSKEQLVNEVLTLQRRVTELEEEQKKRLSSAGDSDQSSIGQPVADKGLRKRLESLSSLEGEVQRLRSENSKLRKASLKEPVIT